MNVTLDLPPETEAGLVASARAKGLSLDLYVQQIVEHGAHFVSPIDTVPVIAHAVAVFGDENKASHWLRTPLPLLAGRAPAELLGDQAGIERVEQILIRIEHNIPS